MDIRDCTKHPFKIECPADLIGEKPDCWYFSFGNGYYAHVGEDDDMTGFWHVIVGHKDDSIDTSHVAWLHDRDNAITDLLEQIAHLENPNQQQKEEKP